MRLSGFSIGWLAITAIAMLAAPLARPLGNLALGADALLAMLLGGGCVVAAPGGGLAWTA